MLVGMMNHPRIDPVVEATWAADNGFEFLDLSLEAPAALPEVLNVKALGEVLQARGLGVVGHTAWYIPFGSPIARLRAAAIAEVSSYFPILAELGADRCNVHADYRSGNLIALEDVIAWNKDCFATLAEKASEFGITVMVEHTPGNPLNSPGAMQAILAADSRLGFHFDAGHAHLDGADKTEAYLALFASRLRHVHLSDNKLRTDDHLPLGAGLISWTRVARLLHAVPYDGTVTLEVFTPDRIYLINSAARWRAWWAESVGS